MRVSITSIFILVLFSFLANTFATISPNTENTFNNFADAVSKAKDGEDVGRTLNIKGIRVYGFNYGEDYLTVDGGKTTKGIYVKLNKPNNPPCNSGACICLCKDTCGKETVCRRIDGINKIIAKSEFLGTNKGAQEGTYYTLALDGKKENNVCVIATRNSEVLEINDCLA